MGGFAWVTLATNDSYSLGALVLAHSLKQAGTQQQLAVLVTPGVTNSMREKLRQVFDLVQEVNILDSRDEANLRLLKRPELGVTFTKLHCWRLTQFEKCVFLDADTLVLGNCDELFEREELSAAPDVGWPDCFNSGVFVYRPSNETYEKLIQFALERGSFDGGDQGLLNLFFSDWAHKDISKHLPFIYNLCSTAGYSYLPAFKQFGGNAKIIHFIGATKPWLQYFDTETRKVHPSGDAQHLQGVLQHWWNIFCSLIHPNLTQDMTPSHTDTVYGSQPYVPYIPPRHVPPPPDFYTYQHVPTPNIPNPAEDYQNVWDPWEEYDIRQSQNRSEQPGTFNEPPSNQYHEPQSNNPTFFTHNYEPRYDDRDQWVQEYSNPPAPPQESISHSFHYQEPPSHNQFETQSHHIENSQQTQLVESHYTNAYLADHHDSRDYQDSHNSHPPPPTYSQPQSYPQFEPAPQSFPHYEPSPPQKIIYEPPPPQEVRHEPPPTPIRHEAPPTPFRHEAPPTPFRHEPPPPVRHESFPPPKEVRYEPPPQSSFPRLPDECVATTVVSNDITLNTGTNEDSNDNSSGLAGAFAQLTLGQPRTAEQAALDDHLRRQGWEVGNIDYLGRDSFENIWSKICETLSAAPESVAKPKDPSPPATSEVTAPEPPPAEVVSKPPAETPAVPQPEPVVAQISAPTEVVAEAPAPESAPQPEVPAATPTETAPAEPQPAAPAPDATPQPTPTPEVPQPAPVVPESPQPAPEPTPAVQEAPQPTPDIPATPQPAEVVPETAQPPPVVPETPQITPAVPQSPQPAPEVPPSPQPAEAIVPQPVVAPETPAAPASTEPTPEIAQPPPAAPEPAPTVAETPQPTPAAPQTPEPTAAAPEAPQPTPVVPEPAPEVPASPQPAPEVPASPQPAPQVPASAEPVPQAPATPQPAPEVPEPTPAVPPSPQPAAETPPSPQPVAETPASPQPVAETPPSPQPVAEAPKSPQPAAVAPAVPASPAAVPETAAATTKSTTKTSKAKAAAAESESTAPACPVAAKPEKKVSKKSAKEPAAPKAEVTEATPPATPVSPSPKSQSKAPALDVEASVPDTPPPAASEASGATPTPPPRKSSGAPKKTSTKPKK